MGKTRFAAFVRILAVALYAATLLPAAGLAAGERPLDFGAALVMPADIAQFGFNDYGIDSGRHFSIEQMVREANSGDWTDPAYGALGIVSVHNLILHPVGGIEEHPGPDITMTSFIYVFSDEEHARDGYLIFEDDTDNPTATDLRNPPALGDESDMTEFVDTLTEGGRTYELHEIDIAFRIGRVVALLVLTAYDDEVDRDDVEAIGAVFESKLLGVLESGKVDGRPTPGLATAIPRYEADELLPSRSHYCALNGEALMQAYNPGGTARTADVIEEFGVVATYCSLGKVLLPSGNGEFLLLGVTPTRFSRASDASRYVDNLFERPGDRGANLETIAEIEVDASELPFDADQLFAYHYARNFGGETLEVTELVVRLGRTVFEIRLNGYTAPGIKLLLDVMADVMACAASACYETLAPPASLVEFQAEQDAIAARR